MNNMRVLVFGDSIAYGEYDSQGGWADRLKTTYLEQRFNNLDDDLPVVYNLSVHGEVLRHLTMRVGQEVVARRSQWEEATDFVLVIAAGLNDTLTHDDGEHFSSLGRYRQDLEDLLAVVRLFSDRLLFVGMTPVDTENPRMRNYTTKRIWQFEQVLREFVRSHSLPFVPLFEMIEAHMREEYILTDGLHPNDEGHRLIYEQVLPSLQNLTAPKPVYTDILGA